MASYKTRAFSVVFEILYPVLGNVFKMDIPFYIRSSKPEFSHYLKRKHLHLLT